MTQVVPFGEITLSSWEGYQTGTYDAANWHKIKQAWNIQVYLATPNGVPIDGPSVTERCDVAMKSPSKGDVLEGVMRRHSDAWNRLADL